MRKYPEELRQKVVNMIKDGTPKIEASRINNIPYRTVMGWTLHIKIRKTYPKQLKNRVRRFVRLGLRKFEVARMLNLNQATVGSWTRDLKESGNAGIRGSTLNFLKLLVLRGYVMSDEVKQFTSGMRTIKKYFPVRRVRMGGRTVWHLPGKEREAMEAFLRKTGKHSIGYGELGLIRKAFNVKRNIFKNK
jgi:transposase-like protein